MDAYSLVSYHFHEINRLQSFMLGSTTFGLLLGERGIGKSLFVRNLTVHLLDEQLQGNLSVHHFVLATSETFPARSITLTFPYKTCSCDRLRLSTVTLTFDPLSVHPLTLVSPGLDPILYS